MPKKMNIEVLLSVLPMTLVMTLSVFCQPRTFDKPSFPFEVFSKHEKPYSQVNILIPDEYFARENLVELFSYLGRKSSLPIRVTVYSNKQALESDLFQTGADRSLESAPNWDATMRSLVILNKTRSVSHRAYYYKDAYVERFNYDLEKSPVRCIVITFYDNRKFENTTESLFSAIKDGYADAVRWIVRQDPRLNFNVLDSTQSTPLSWAVWLHHNDIAEMLLKAGADVDQGLPEETALFTAIEGHNFEGVRILIDAKADVNKAISEGKTPLMAAALNCDFNIVRLLLERGAKADATNSFGKSAIDYCGVSSVKELIRSHLHRN
jgi:ankyrin repeat protein